MIFLQFDLFIFMKESNKKPTIIETEAAGLASRDPNAEVPASLKYESSEGICFAYPPTVAVDPAETPYGFLRGPKLARLPDGRWICMMLTGGPTEPHPENVAMAAIGEADAKTWGKPKLLFRSNKRRCVPATYFDADGKFGVFVQTLIPDSYNLELRIHLSWYDSQKDSWSVPALLRGCPPVRPMDRLVASDGAFVCPSFWVEGCDQLRPGDLGEEPPQWSSDWDLAPAKREYRHVCGLLISRDQGETFQVRGYISHPEVNLWEPTLVELTPGHFVMYMRAEGSGFLYRSESLDGGETWSPAEATDIINPSTKPAFLKIGDSILLFHNPNPGIGFYKRKQLEVWVSHDGLKTWQAKIPIANSSRSDRPICYPDPVYLPESHEIMLLLDTARKAYLQRIPCEDLGVPRPSA